MNLDRQFERQERLFGSQGQDRISRSHILVCGVGGIGSHICQLLTHLGVRRFTLIDNDVVDRSNLNRLIGSSEIHVGCAKVEVVKGHIQNICPDAAVHLVRAQIGSAGKRLERSRPSVVVGCVDNDSARLQLIDYSSGMKVPYLDVATEIHPQEGIIGGQVLFSYGDGCHLCAGLIDQEEVMWTNATESERQFHRESYGISEEYLKDSGPSVVYLNGLIASLAVAELQMLLTGIDRPIPLTVLQRRSQFRCWTVSQPELSSNVDCYYCARYSAVA